MIKKFIKHRVDLYMKLAFSTNAFKRYSLEDSIREIGAIGYEGVEILCDVPHLFPPLFSKQRLSRLSNFLEKQHLKVSNLNAFTLYAINDLYHPSWIEMDKRSTDIRIMHTINCLKAARHLGANNISTEGGGPRTANTSKRTDLVKLFAKNIEQAVKIAEAEKVRILVEPEPGLIIENSSQITEFLKSFDSKSIGLNCDLGHFFCVGEDPAEVVYQLAEYIGHFHLADISNDRVHNHLLPGTGSINFKDIFDATRSVGYHGFITVELYTYENNPIQAAHRAYEYLQRFV
ncbi:MAG: sugar phosphate isomerase/epimerase [Nitrososphaeraceae archaeon]